MDNVVQAVVQKVISGGKHGPYAVATAEEVEGSITFSLSGDIWRESSWPSQGEIVLLSYLRKKRAGWRAMKGRYIRPSDQQSASSKESK